MRYVLLALMIFALGCLNSQENEKFTLEECEIEYTQKMKDICFSIVARDVQNISLCSEIMAVAERDSCITDVGLDIGNVSSCLMITEDEARDNCNLKMAWKIFDPTICKNIKSERKRGICLERTG